VTRSIVLLRGINLGPNRRVSMPALRELLEGAGFGEVRTHLASGNVVLEDGASSEDLTARCEQLILERFGFSVAVVTRTRDELAEVVARDPLGSVAQDPKRYQVTFAIRLLDSKAITKLEALAAPSEQLVAIGRELYSWHPAGVARSRLWSAIAGKGLGVAATSRNWNTVAALLELADAG
jgi:uncharacterized protein (DUF1697 family)